MRNISQLLNEIIPPSDYQNRNEFSNEYIIQILSKLRDKVEKKILDATDKQVKDIFKKLGR